MKILVCIKQVLESELSLEPTPDGGYQPTARPRWRLNRFCEHAVEQALLLAEAAKGPVRTEAVTVGPQRAKEVLTRALGMGADHAAHILTQGDQPRDPAVTASPSICPDTRRIPSSGRGQPANNTTLRRSIKGVAMVARIRPCLHGMPPTYLQGWIYCLEGPLVLVFIACNAPVMPQVLRAGKYAQWCPR